MFCASCRANNDDKVNFCHRGHWIILSMILFLVSACSGLGSTPTTTLETQCTAFTNHDYKTAYDQLDSKSQKTVSEQQFASLAQQGTTGHGGLTNCTVTNVNESGSSANGVATFTFSDGTTYSVKQTLIDENNVWKISSTALIPTR